ncbi:hypothetical protein PMI16_04611 [Herbaspirillum sp. CF444]|nr:hypothetical protein PMI16_04611 [Herbaspirillum sp. CF444]
MMAEAASTAKLQSLTRIQEVKKLLVETHAAETA